MEYNHKKRKLAKKLHDFSIFSLVYTPRVTKRQPFIEFQYIFNEQSCITINKYINAFYNVKKLLDHNTGFFKTILLVLKSFAVGLKKIVFY